MLSIAISRRLPRRRHAVRPTKAPRSLARSKESERAIHPSMRSAPASIAWRSGRNGRFRAMSGAALTTRRRSARGSANATARLTARDPEDLELEERRAQLRGREVRGGGDLVERARDAADRRERARFHSIEQRKSRLALRSRGRGFDSEERERVLGAAHQDGVAVMEKTMARGAERFIDVPRNRADRPLHGA